MSIQFQSEQTEIPQIDTKKIFRWINKVVAQYQKKTGAVTYIFCSDNRILEINNQYLGHDYYTDIITFDYSENNKISGDIFISIDTVRSNAEKYRTNFDDELNRVIIHGILHLCGQKDKTESEAQEMRSKENNALSLLESL